MSKNQKSKNILPNADHPLMGLKLLMDQVEQMPEVKKYQKVMDVVSNLRRVCCEEYSSEQMKTIEQKPMAPQ
jgi:hypothetical protein